MMLFCEFQPDDFIPKAALCHPALAPTMACHTTTQYEPGQQFQLPIEYQTEVSTLSDVVAQDLELVESSVGRSMYEHALHGEETVPHPFEASIRTRVAMKTTTSTAFLEDTYELVSSWNESSYNTSPLPSNEVSTWWKEKEDSYFLQKYSFIEWQCLEGLNHSETFLQLISMLNLVSPLLSLLLPVFCLFLPFLLLRVQGIPLTIETYLRVLREIVKNHFLGRCFVMENWDVGSVLYAIFAMAFYGFQTYQNVNSCLHYYENMTHINTQLLHLQQYLDGIYNRGVVLASATSTLSTYKAFHTTLTGQLITMKNIHDRLATIKPFSWSWNQWTDMGHQLVLYYHMVRSTDYEDALSYATGLDGYIHLLEKLHHRIQEGVFTKTNWTTVAPTKSSEEDDTSPTQIMEDMLYPALMKSTVPNTIEIDRPYIITGPNASGKTTLLKTVLLNYIFSQQWGGGFYRQATLVPYDHFHSYLNIPDTSERDSLFQAESRRCKDILDVVQANPIHTHFCIFDELYSGTNPTDAVKSGIAFLKYIQKLNTVNYMLTTHYTTLCEALDDQVANVHMEAIPEEKDMTRLKFTYRIQPGISYVEGGVNVLKQMEYPDEILDTYEGKGTTQLIS